ncbi:hypothetical protein A2U01_0061628, partial [Trifolium medium]|nr:hypothetical protein [Trifolium medium]
MDFLHEMAGEYVGEGNLDGANLDLPCDDINEDLDQLIDHCDDQVGASPNPDLEGRRKKRHERDVDEGDSSSKKCKLYGPESQKVVDAQAGVIPPSPSSSSPLSVDHLLTYFGRLSVSPAS